MKRQKRLWVHVVFLVALGFTLSAILPSCSDDDDDSFQVKTIQDEDEGYVDETSNTDDIKGTSGNYTCYFENTGKWSAVYCYAYRGVGANYYELNGEFPGTACKKTDVTSSDGYEIWSWSYDGVIPMYVVFSNGVTDDDESTDTEGDTESEDSEDSEEEDAAQTSDLVFVDEATYSYDDQTAGNEAVDYTEYGIYAFFINQDSWTTVYCWAWQEGGDGATYMGTSWPGVKMSKVSDSYEYDNETYELWLWKYDGETTTPPDYVIFNNSSDQTADLPFVNGGIYNYTYNSALSGYGRYTGYVDYTSNYTSE